SKPGTVGRTCPARGENHYGRVPNLLGPERERRGDELVGEEGCIVTSTGFSSLKSSRVSESTRICSPFRIASTPAPAPAPVAPPMIAPLPPPEIAPIAAPIAAPSPADLAVRTPCEAPVFSNVLLSSM